MEENDPYRRLIYQDSPIEDTYLGANHAPCKNVLSTPQLDLKSLPEEGKWGETLKIRFNLQINFRKCHTDQHHQQILTILSTQRGRFPRNR